MLDGSVILCNSPRVVPTPPAHQVAPVASAVRQLARRIDAFQDRFGRAVSWLMLVMVLVVFMDVILRYAFNVSFVFTQELEWHLFGIVYLHESASPARLACLALIVVGVVGLKFVSK